MRWAVLAAVVATVAGVLSLPRGTAGDQSGEGDPDVPARVLETGVEVFSLWRDWPVNEQMLDGVAASGSGWVRVGVGWCSLEQAGPGLVSRWYQDRLDATVAAAQARALRVLATLASTPG